MKFPEFVSKCVDGMLEVSFVVSEKQTDAAGIMRLSELARQMEKITEKHLLGYGLDRKSLDALGKAWVISWSAMHINRMPKLGEKIILRIWPGKTKFVMYTRHYAFFLENQTPLVSAASVFVLMDLSTRKAATPIGQMKQIPIVSIDGEAMTPILREELPEHFAVEAARTVVADEIDLNGHMNNACYLDWADDVLSDNGLSDKRPEYVWIQYSKELLEGQTSKLLCTASENELSMISTYQGEEFFAVKIKFNDGKDKKTMSFIDNIMVKAKVNKQKIAVPEYSNEYMLKAAVKAHNDGVAEIILVGDPAEIKASAEEFGLDITGIQIADLTDAAYITGLLDKYAEMPTKVMPRNFVEKRIKNSLYLATLMEAVGEVDATIAGVDTTTYEFVLAANSIIGLEPGCPSASGSLIMEIDGWNGAQGNVFACSDGAVCIDPNTEQHAYIAIGSCETFEAVTGEKARCAFLSYSTDGSGGSSDHVKKVRAALELAKEKRPDLAIDGEFQADAAIDLRVGQKKVKRESEVAGQANVLIFPDAAACNIATKLVQRLGGATVYGPLYQGFRKPILDCSRSDTDDILYNDMALLSVLAAAKK